MKISAVLLSNIPRILIGSAFVLFIFQFGIWSRKVGANSENIPRLKRVEVEQVEVSS